jgi:hypothetical protein
MDFGKCFVVFLVAFLYLAAWIDELSKKMKKK